MDNCGLWASKGIESICFIVPTALRRHMGSAAFGDFPKVALSGKRRLVGSLGKKREKKRQTWVEEGEGNQARRERSCCSGKALVWIRPLMPQGCSLPTRPQVLWGMSRSGPHQLMMTVPLRPLETCEAVLLGNSFPFKTATTTTLAAVCY